MTALVTVLGSTSWNRRWPAMALDVFYTPVQMKKNRPGIHLTVLCEEADADKFHELILRETTAFGARQTVARNVSDCAAKSPR